MTRKDSKGMDPSQFMDAVVRNSTRFWEGMAGFTWPGQESGAGGAGAGEYNPWEPWEPALDAWKQFQESCTPETFTGQFEKVREEGFKQFEKMAKSGWENFVSMGDGFGPTMGWGQQAFGMGVPDMFSGKGTFKEMFKMMSGEMNRFISIPPLGLSRNYQEKVVEVVEKGNQFLLTLGEYMFLMFSPLEQSMRMVQVTIEGLTDEQRRTLTPESVYETWLKELEQGYFTLYGSEEYLGLLKRLVSAMGEFNMARQNFISDFLKLMGVPSENDLDDLYRDLYSIKKTLSSLENSVEALAQAAKAPQPAPKKAAKPKAAPKTAKPAPKAAVKPKEAAKTAKAPSAQAKPGETPRTATPAGKPSAPVTAKSPDKASKPTKPTAKPAGKTP
ncbi:poly(R)-hydroxyalkanoic acid synthase subunit PhaE [Desulfoluna butyratoxydans]|uniref:Poly(3-hydroxyalkanoate) polymerase subunit PhaE n=1 Tax=Desulfoluna butyratoxydans TaxID=231438 RepID=A0A4U8YTS3_9BACT|nr:poly(R)-hydroxyalkanoic acid synthase subunit PhaE [Desulfoluna butyratoxydans]VFQ47361.1 poly(r)-hydroxyalkanoic acid synthase class iii phae subunit [Desulfoluna butyratoxydans]